jgi:hypothetical protein
MLRLSLVKITRTWNPVPNVEQYQSAAVRLVSAAWTIPVYALAAIGLVFLVRRDRWLAVAMVAPAIVILLMHAVFVGSVRYRLPAMPFLEILTAYGSIALIDRLRRSRYSSKSDP